MEQKGIKQSITPSNPCTLKGNIGNKGSQGIKGITGDRGNCVRNELYVRNNEIKVITDSFKIGNNYKICFGNSTDDNNCLFKDDIINIKRLAR